MIRYGNFRLAGLKQTDIANDIDRIIDQARQFILICGYSFSSYKNMDSTVRKIIDSPIPTKHCILPIHLFRTRDANRPLAMELIRRGVSVSIESNNHSKWLMSEGQIYFGSANFSLASLSNRIEVVSFLDFGLRDPLRSEFAAFAIESISRMSRHSDRRSLWGMLRTNDQLLASAREQILVLNPTIEKVISTVKATNKVRAQVYEALDNCYWFLDDKSFLHLTMYLKELDQLLRDINVKGANLIAASNDSSDFKRKVNGYNSECRRFYQLLDEFKSTSRQLIPEKGSIPQITSINRRLSRHCLDELREYKVPIARR
jgi:hypothetical protein